MTDGTNVKAGPTHWLGPLVRWRICPSTHCLRHQECRSPHECSGTGKNLTPERRAELSRAHGEQAREGK